MGLKAMGALDEAARVLSASEERARRRKLEHKRALRGVEMRTEEEAADAEKSAAAVAKEAIEKMRHYAVTAAKHEAMHAANSDRLAAGLREATDMARRAAEALPPEHGARKVLLQAMEAMGDSGGLEARLSAHGDKTRKVAEALSRKCESLAKLF